MTHGTNAALRQGRLDGMGAAAASATAILYGSSYVATAIALRGFTPITVAFWRGLIGALALALVMVAWRSARLRMPGNRAALVRLLVLATLNGPAFLIAMNFAVSLAGASITAFVAGLYAVLAAALAIPLLGERPERLTIAALLVALAGAALLGEIQLGGKAATGVGWALLAAVVFALFLVLSRRWSIVYDLPGPTIGMFAMGLSALVAGLWAAAAGTILPPVAPGADAVAAVIWLALAVGALATVLVVVGMRRLPARRASAFLLLNPPTAALLSWLLLGETFSGLQLVGAALVLVAMAAATGLVAGSRRRVDEEAVR
jgi:drug/metabolite transporter (DMT)-like permease